MKLEKKSKVEKRERGRHSRNEEDGSVSLPSSSSSLQEEEHLPFAFAP